ncbi:MAG: xanthine dehydrogenase family protein subunit M [Rhodospirillales bacterium]|nr:xanthine dehydrogenase family protein subunit M [Rhodospirillales bacterium]
MHDFGYHRPTTLADAAAALESAEDGKLMAGGQTMIPTLKQRLAQPSDIVDLGAVEALTGIREEGGALAIGAMTTHAEVAASDLVKARIPALANLAGGIGDPQVRHRGTIGGSIANNDPAADYPAGCVGLGATIHTGKRQIAADDFFTGLFETALEENEIVTAVSFPLPGQAAYAKFPNPASRYAIVGVMVAQTGDSVRVAVTGAGPCVFRDRAIEAALSSNFSASAVGTSSADESALNSDIHASAEYRKHLIGVMAKRAVAAAGG